MVHRRVGVGAAMTADFARRATATTEQPYGLSRGEAVAVEHLVAPFTKWNNRRWDRQGNFVLATRRKTYGLRRAPKPRHFHDLDDVFAASRELPSWIPKEDAIVWFRDLDHVQAFDPQAYEQMERYVGQRRASLARDDRSMRQVTAALREQRTRAEGK